MNPHEFIDVEKMIARIRSEIDPAFVETQLDVDLADIYQSIRQEALALAQRHAGRGPQAEPHDENGGHRAFIDTVCRSVLGRFPRADEIEAHARFIESEKKHRLATLEALLFSPEAEERYAALLDVPAEEMEPDFFSHMIPASVAEDAGAQEHACTLDGCDLHALLNLPDMEFIRRAYLSILKREPEEQGLAHHLENLRSYRMTKIQILGRMRYCAEGRRKGVPVKGLLLPFFIDSLKRVPVLGYLFNYLFIVLRLPTIIHNINKQHQFALNRLAAAEEKIKAAEKRDDALKTSLNDLKNALAKDRQLEDAKRLELLYTLYFLMDSENQKIDRLDSDMDRLDRDLDEFKNKDEKSLFYPLYQAFEDRFRGVKEAVRNKQEIYLPLIKAAVGESVSAPVLDIGCGRGEWLALCRKNGYQTQGVDINSDSVALCRNEGFDVSLADALEYLNATADNTFAAVTGFHIAEHLTLNYLITLLDEVLRVLKPDGVLILESPNPENVITGSCNFYLDPTHRAPLPPALLLFLLEVRGFKEVRPLRINENTDFQFEEPLLNKLMFGPQDYAAIGMKRV